MRTIPDAHRSLARYIATILPDFDVWRLRTEPQEDRPYAVVKPVQMPAISHSRKQIVEIVQPFIAYIYPEVATSALAGQARKFEIEEALIQAFWVGSAGRIPLYDYDGIADDEPGPALQQVSAYLEDGVTPAGYDYMECRSTQVNSSQDAQDERRWSITLTVRLAWRRHGQLVSGVPLTAFSVGPGSQALQ